MNITQTLFKKMKFFYTPVSPNFCARRCVMMIRHGLSWQNFVNFVENLSSLKNRAKLLLVSLPVSPSRVLRAPGTSPYHLVPSSLKNRAKLLLSSSPEFKKPSCCCPHNRCHHLGYSVPPAHHRTIWCRSTFGPCGPGLSSPTSFLRPALPMAPTTDNNARDERSVLRPNPATFLRDFTLYMTTNYAIIWKRCLNYTAIITL